MGFDTEFSSLDVKEAYCAVIALYNYENNTGYALACNHYTKEQLVFLMNRLQTVEILIAHNASVDVGVLYSNFGVLLTNVHCTMIRSQIIDSGLGFKMKNTGMYYTKNMVGGIPQLPSLHSLLSCLQRYLNITLHESGYKKLMQKKFIGSTPETEITDEMLRYAAEDTIYLPKLFLAQEKYIKDRNLYKAVELDRKLLPVIIKIEQRGITIDTEKLDSFIQKSEQELHEVELQLDELLIELGVTNIKLRKDKEITQILDLFGNSKSVIVNNINIFNYNSSAALADLFKNLQLPLPQTNDGVESFNEEALLLYKHKDFVDQRINIFIDLLLKQRELFKLVTTFGKKLKQSLDSNNLLRTRYYQAVAATGRLTSVKIDKVKGQNLANIPKNRELRACFVPRKGYKFVDCDMTGQEVAIAAAYSKDPLLLKALLEGVDHHSVLASATYSIIFKKPIEIQNKDIEIEHEGYTYNLQALRDDHKPVLFSKIYLGGAKRLLTVLNKYIVRHHPPEDHLTIAKDVSDTIDKKIPTLIKYLKSKVDFVQKHGYVETKMLGRRRYFDDPSKAYGDAANYEIQATGALAMKLAMYKIDRWFTRKEKELNMKPGELGYIVLTIYDQVVCELKQEYVDSLAPEIQQLMAESLGYFLDGVLEGKSDLNIRDYWGK